MTTGSLTQEQQERLITEFPSHLEAMARFSLSTGLRESYVTGLMREQMGKYETRVFTYKNNPV